MRHICGSYTHVYVYVVTGHKKVCQPFRPSPGVDFSVWKNEEWLAGEKYAGHQYTSQHVTPEDKQYLWSIWCLTTWARNKGLKWHLVTNLASIPIFFYEYFSQIEPFDLTDTSEYKSALWVRYQSRHWSYIRHLCGYHRSITQKNNRKLDTFEIWRRFGCRQKPFAYLLK